MYLSSIGGRHINIDVSMGQIRLGKRLISSNTAKLYYPELNEKALGWIHGNAELTLPILGDSADVVYGIGTLNHLGSKKWTNFLKEMLRVTKKDGFVFHVIPNLDCEIFHRRYFRDQYKRFNSIQYYTQFVEKERVVKAFHEAGINNVKIRKI